MEKKEEEVLHGFPPTPSQIYLEKQPNLTLFCKPKILPLKSPNLKKKKKMEIAANNTQSPEVPDIISMG